MLMESKMNGNVYHIDEGVVAHLITELANGKLKTLINILITRLQRVWNISRAKDHLVVVLLPHIYLISPILGAVVTSRLWYQILMTIHFHLPRFALSLDHFRHLIRPQHGLLSQGRTSGYVGHLHLDLNKAL